MRFVKGHGTENDFVLLPDLPEPALTPQLVRRLCDRRAGIGADGVLRVGRDGAGWFMDYRNADGSVAEMCGNGIRVFVRYLLDEGLTGDKPLRVGTRAGVKEVALNDDAFTEAPDELWADVLRRKGGIYELVARIPEDPSVN